VQYAIAFDYLYTMTVTKSGVTLNRTAIDGKFAENVNFLLEFMKGHVESLTSAARTRFCDVSRNLFEVLLGPSSELIKGKALILVPDGSLSYLPFEALLESPPNGTRQDYRKLPYLIRNHSISYGLTATLFYHRSTRITKPTRRVLVVAPSYHLASGKISDYIRRAESGLPELKGTLLESKAIKRMTGGRLLKGEHATEAKFKSIGPKYGILHLAMHSINDRTNSLNSSLVFTPGSDDVEDGVLFGHEIYDLSLNAQLTVLSACETGSGQMSGGEGVLSFGRAFITAGCPNLIMTLWTVDDRSSRELMVNFYRSLIAGNGIANALQHSKMDYLGEVDQVHAHPHFWAGFIELGQDQVLNVSYKKPGLIVLVVFFSLSILIFVLIQIKKKSPPKRGYDGKE
jgi:CHAT domain-containing protein